MFTDVPPAPPDPAPTTRPRKGVERFAFTEKLLAALELPAEGSRYVYDTLEAGLCVRLTPTRKRYAFYKWHHGKPDRLTLPEDSAAEVGSIPLRQIRGIVTRLRGELAAGIDVFARARQAKRPVKVITLDQAFQAHLVGGDLRPASQANYISLWRRVPASLKSKAITDITEHDLRALHTAIGAKHKRTSNLVITLIATLMKRNGRRHPNPADEVRRYRSEPRARVLTLGEIHQIRDALESEQAPWKNFFTLLMLTGARRGAMAAMRWADVDLEAGVWRIPAAHSKNHRVIAVALATEAIAILGELERERGGSLWVFPARSASGHIASPTWPWRRVCARAGVVGATIHDIRRTTGTAIASDGASAAVIAAVLGHTSQQSARAYIHLSAEAGRAAIERVAERTKPDADRAA